MKIYSMKNKIMIFGMTIFEFTDSIEIENNMIARRMEDERE